MIIGILREEKNPPDRRVPFNPDQCKKILSQYPDIHIKIQPSEIRCYPNKFYENSCVEVTEDLSNCDILFGVKEVPPDLLIPNKKYLFFSHTIKKQESNKNILLTGMERNIQLIDYECLTDENNQRILGFGNYAGIAGTYNALLCYGKRKGLFELPRAYELKSCDELFEKLKKTLLPAMKILITGDGRVASGIIDTLSHTNARPVDKNSFLVHSVDSPVYFQARPEDIYEHVRGESWDFRHYCNNPEQYKSRFLPLAMTATSLITGHYWNSAAPPFFTLEEMSRNKFNLEVVADISCDVPGPIPTTIMSTTIHDPVYGFNVATHKPGEAYDPGNITVMAVDNLPCELPRDSSTFFGDEILQKVLPLLIEPKKDQFNVIERASIIKDGQLMPDYQYLGDYLTM